MNNNMNNSNDLSKDSSFEVNRGSGLDFDSKLDSGTSIKYDKMSVSSDLFNILSTDSHYPTTYNLEQAMSLFNSLSDMRFHIYYHNIKQIVVDYNIHKRTMLLVGLCKLVFKKRISDSCIYVGLSFTVYNYNSTFYIGGFVMNDNINYSIFESMDINNDRLFTVPFVIMFNSINNFGLGISDLMVIPYHPNYSIYYDNFQDMNYIYSSVRIIYYNELLCNNVSRYSTRNRTINIKILNKYNNDLLKHINNSYGYNRDIK